ncbi:hypothetical protein LOK49_LG08G01496 [Camellia lanceoleosa]|uniref:Uncharacterized protein n=1 Tax=Camellia lanceoleosa TaxID=1840588 RepID=A0ACC0GPF9_9ERIC|nr:hypothetical protein LOK49_LG08G01496 [Camellia lanceoleosa]
MIGAAIYIECSSKTQQFTISKAYLCVPATTTSSLYLPTTVQSTRAPAQVRELKKTDHANHTITVLLVGIPNVGKSALANSLHHIGQISATEKGKLKHAIVSPLPGETKDISSLKLPLSVCVYHIIAKVFVMTGAINDCLIGEAELAHFFLANLNLSDEYKQWSKLSTNVSEKLSDDKVKTSVNSELDKRRKHIPQITHRYKHFSDQLIIIHLRAKPVPYLTFEEAVELAYFGAQVLHPQSMRPAREGDIPVRVKNSYNPKASGTLITKSRDMKKAVLTSIVLKRNVTMLDIVSIRMLGQFGFLAKVFSIFEDLGISMDVVPTSEVSISLTLDPSKL